MSLAASFGLWPVCFASQLSGPSSPSAPDTESSIRFANRMRAPASSRSSLAISLIPSAASAPVYRSGSSPFRNGVTPSRAARTGANRALIGPTARRSDENRTSVRNFSVLSVQMQRFPKEALPPRPRTVVRPTVSDGRISPATTAAGRTKGARRVRTG